jgi:hypothetical protein
MMCVLRKHLALLAIAESSEAGRLIALRAVIEAVRQADIDLPSPLDNRRAEDLLRALLDEESEDASLWLDTFSRRLAQIAMPGVEQTIEPN